MIVGSKEDREEKILKKKIQKHLVKYEETKQLLNIKWVIVGALVDTLLVYISIW